MRVLKPQCYLLISLGYCYAALPLLAQTRRTLSENTRRSQPAAACAL